MSWLTVTTAPTAYPVTRAEVLNYIRIEDDADLPVAEETLIDALIASATEQVESYLRRSLITRTYTFSLDCQPWIIELPMPPLKAVASVKVLSEDGTETVQAATLYTAQIGDASRIALKDASVWGSTTRNIDLMRVLYTAGYGDAAANVPADIRNAILNQVAWLHGNREISAELNTIAQGMIHRYRCYRF